VQAGCYQCLSYGVPVEECIQCVYKGDEASRESCYQCLRTGAGAPACGQCSNLDASFSELRQGCVNCASAPSVIQAGAGDQCVQCSNAGLDGLYQCINCMVVNPMWAAACVQCLGQQGDNRDNCYTCLSMLSPGSSPWGCTV